MDFRQEHAKRNNLFVEKTLPTLIPLHGKLLYLWCATIDPVADQLFKIFAQPMAQKDATVPPNRCNIIHVTMDITIMPQPMQLNFPENVARYIIFRLRSFLQIYAGLPAKTQQLLKVALIQLH